MKQRLLSLAAIALALHADAGALAAAANPQVKAAKLPELRVRLQTERGPVYVFRPLGVRPIATVVYVHGYFNNADSAWKRHELARKFSHSRLPAVFVVPEAPVAAKDPVTWPDLAELLQVVQTAKPHALPRDVPLVAVGHSAAYRTIANWLSHPQLQEVMLLDALYGLEDAYAQWLAEASERRLVLIVRTTGARTGDLIKRFHDVKRLPRIPPSGSKRFRGFRLLAVQSQYGHMEIVTEALAAVLQMSRYAR